MVFEDVYQNDVLVATHADIQDKGQTVKFKSKPEQPKPEQPSKQPEKPVQPQPKVEQPIKVQPIVKAVEPAPKKSKIRSQQQVEKKKIHTGSGLVQW